MVPAGNKISAAAEMAEHVVPRTINK